jgi:hypothetical protein
VTLALIALVLAAGPKPGTWVMEGGFGTAVLIKGHFTIETEGGNAHSCSLTGAWAGEKGTVSDEGLPCEVSFTMKGEAMEISAVTEEACSAWCGARARFTGTYVLPAKSCAANAVKQTRATFKKQYGQKHWPEAVATLEPLLATCGNVLERFEAGWVRNDLALAQHHAGDDAACLMTLMPLGHFRDDSGDDLAGAEPALEDLIRKLALATRTNAKLCGYASKK